MVCANICSRVLSIKRGRSRRKADKLWKVWDLFYRVASGGRSQCRPRINCLNDFQLFNSHFFWVITRLGCFCAVHLSACAPRRDGRAPRPQTISPQPPHFLRSFRWPEAFEGKSEENFQFDTNWSASSKCRWCCHLPSKASGRPISLDSNDSVFVLFPRAALEVFNDSCNF